MTFETIVSLNTETILRLAGAAGAVVASLLAGMLLRRFFVRRLVDWSARTKTGLDDAVAASLGRPMVIWAVLGGAYAAARVVEAPEAWAHLWDRLLAAVLVASATFWVADVATRWLALARSGPGGEASLLATGLARNVVRVSVFAIGALVLLGSLGVSITPLLTPLGVGGIALALGLQNSKPSTKGVW
jgi:small-conductance mechanosensitive channel